MTATDSSANTGTTAVRPKHRFDVAALDRWMQSHVDTYAGPLRVEEFKGGQSNPTYKLVTSSRTYVLRRKPPGKLLKGAHAVDREVRILRALEATDVPVARVLASCDDGEVIGTAFYVMEMVEGRIHWDATFSEVPTPQRLAHFDAMNEALAALHRLEPQALGLTDFGRSQNYVKRQIERWSGQYLADRDAGRNPAMDKLVEWLPANIPEGEDLAIVHGDYRCDNIIFHPTQPKILAVLDWELSTLGDPLVDFAYHAMMYRMPPDIVAGLAGIDCRASGLPSESEYLASYCVRTGRKAAENYEYYVAFNLFRVAAIFHGIRGRAMRGTAASANARARGENFARLAQLAWASARKIG